MGVVGAGTVAELHAAALTETPGMELAAVADRRTDRAVALAAKYGARTPSRLENLLTDDSIDALFVLTPTATHVDLAHRCLDAGKHALVEKRVSENPAAIEGLAEHARRAGRVVMPGHNYLNLPECQRAVRQARTGQLGQLRALFVTYAIAHSDELASRYAGVLSEVLVHTGIWAWPCSGAPVPRRAERAPQPGPLWTATIRDGWFGNMTVVSWPCCSRPSPSTTVG